MIPPIALEGVATQLSPHDHIVSVGFWATRPWGRPAGPVVGACGRVRSLPQLVDNEHSHARDRAAAFELLDAIRAEERRSPRAVQ